MAQAPAAPQVAPVPAQPAAPTLAAPVASQPLVLDAGAGVLVQLPRPVATIIAADPRVARVQPASPTSLFVIGVAQGRTTLIATNEAGQAVVQYDVTVRRPGGEAPVVPGVAPVSAPPPPSARELRAGNASAAQAAVRQHVVGAGGVTVKAVEGNLVLAGTVATAQQSLNVETISKSFVSGGGGIVNNMTVLSSLQVNVRVRVAEISRAVTRNLGINWRVIGQSGNFVFGFLTPSGIASSGLGALTGVSNNLIGLGYHSGPWDANAIIDSLAANDLVTILAEPNLTALSGEPASFLAGGEFPVPVPQQNGVTTVEYKQYGVSLAVVPTVLAPGRISMRIRPEASDIDKSNCISLGGSILNPSLACGIKTRRAETTIELGSGQSFAIAGLLSDSMQDNPQAVALLGELPILGALFRSTSFKRNQTELVIIVTPYLVNPVNTMAQLRAPTDGFQPATDLGRVLYGRQIRNPATSRPVDSRIDAGFILK